MCIVGVSPCEQFIGLFGCVLYFLIGFLLLSLQHCHAISEQLDVLFNSVNVSSVLIKCLLLFQTLGLSDRGGVGSATNLGVASCSGVSVLHFK